MEPFTLGLGMAQVIGNFMNGSSSKALSREQMQQQQQLAAEQMRMAQAGRTDAYGNKTYYDPVTNQWKTELTPLQKALLSAEQTEQSRSLNEDAPRARRLRERQAQMSEEAAAPYNKALQGYIYDQPKSEGAIRDELQTGLIQSDYDRAKEGQATLAQSALRQGGRISNLPALIKKIDETIRGGTSENIMKANEGARSRHMQDVQTHDARYLPEMQQFKQIIDAGGGDANIRFGNTNAQAASTQANQASAMQNAITSAMSGLNSATRNSIVANNASKLDFSPIIRALNAKTSTKEEPRWDKAPAKVDYSTIPDYLMDIPYGRKDSEGYYF